MKRTGSGYVDPIAVERAVLGDPVHMTPKERTAAAQLLTRRGYSTREVAERIGVSQRTVTRCRGRELVEVSAFG